MKIKIMISNKIFFFTCQFAFMNQGSESFCNKEFEKRSRDGIGTETLL
jgi:hypothetical protein